MDENNNDYEVLVEKARNFHGEVCPGIVMGTRMTIAALRELGMNPHERNRDLIVYVEIDRCMTDAVQAIAGVSVGHRSLKVRDYGKFAATFVDTANNRAIRVSAINKPNREGEEMEDISKRLSKVPVEEIFKIEEVKMDIPENDLPGFPRQKTVCSICGEKIMDGKEVVSDGKIVCKPCAEGTYYTKMN